VSWHGIWCVSIEENQAVCALIPTEDLRTTKFIVINPGPLSAKIYRSKLEMIKTNSWNVTKKIHSNNNEVKKARALSIWNRLILSKGEPTENWLPQKRPIFHGQSESKWRCHPVHDFHPLLLTPASHQESFLPVQSWLNGGPSQITCPKSSNVASKVAVPAWFQGRR
jgi:hypothetical protein